MSTDTERDEEMESNQPHGMKRRADDTVDSDPGTSIPSSKKIKAEVDTLKKTKVLQFIVRCFVKLHESRFSSIDPSYLNILLGCQITNIIFAHHSFLQQQAAGMTENQGTKSKNVGKHRVTTQGKTYTITFEEAAVIVKNSATANGLEYKAYSPDDHDNWYGTAGAYLNFFMGFKLRWDELRLGHASMAFTKEGGKSKILPVSKYGLSVAHHSLLEGCRYPPEQRRSMAQSLGPMTTLLCHIRSEAKFRNKWTIAAKQAMSHVPFIDDILEQLKDKKASEVRGLISLLANILLITMSGQTQRMFFPLNMIARVVSFPVNENDIMIDPQKKPTGDIGGTTLLKNMKMSGAKCFYFYKLASKFKWKIEGEMTETEAAQATFHSIFGTYKEDLSVLETITNVGEWLRRKQFGNHFQKPTTSGKMKEFNLPVLSHYSKLSSTIQTDLLSSTYTQISALPDDFQQQSKKVGTSTAIKSIAQLTFVLSKTLKELLKKISEDEETLEIGTSQWFKMEDLTLTEPGSPCDLIVQCKCKFFL